MAVIIDWVLVRYDVSISKKFNYFNNYLNKFIFIL